MFVQNAHVHRGLRGIPFFGFAALSRWENARMNKRLFGDQSDRATKRGKPMRMRGCFPGVRGQGREGKGDTPIPSGTPSQKYRGNDESVQVRLRLSSVASREFRRRKQGCTRQRRKLIYSLVSYRKGELIKRVEEKLPMK